MEENIDAYLRGDLAPKDAIAFANPLDVPRFPDDGTEECSANMVLLPTYRCELPGNQPSTIYRSKNERGRSIFTNE